MNYSRAIKLTLSITSLVMVNCAMAATPGTSKAHWRPEIVHQLNANEVRALNAAKCLITSYRNEDVTPTKNMSREPDAHDELMLRRGEFASQGQNDLLVLCRSSESKERYLFVVWGGPKQCANKLSIKGLSRYMKKHGQSEDRYGAHLWVLPAPEVLGEVDKLFNAYEEQSQDIEGQGATFEYWRMKRQIIPVIDHDSIRFLDNYDSILYCDGNKWVQLLDAYTDYTD